jgi:uncharacterized glyoxalase superfamily protein PhnB
MVAVDDVDKHHERAVAEGANLHRELQTYPVIGERQYSVEDLGGHLWTFTQSVADVDPATGPTSTARHSRLGTERRR